MCLLFRPQDVSIGIDSCYRIHAELILSPAESWHWVSTLTIPVGISIIKCYNSLISRLRPTENDTIDLLDKIDQSIMDISAGLPLDMWLSKNIELSGGATRGPSSNPDLGQRIGQFFMPSFCVVPRFMGFTCISLLTTPRHMLVLLFTFLTLCSLWIIKVKLMPKINPPNFSSI